MKMLLLLSMLLTGCDYPLRNKAIIEEYKQCKEAGMSAGQTEHGDVICRG